MPTIDDNVPSLRITWDKQKDGIWLGQVKGDTGYGSVGEIAGKPGEDRPWFLYSGASGVAANLYAAVRDAGDAYRAMWG